MNDIINLDLALQTALTTTPSTKMKRTRKTDSASLTKAKKKQKRDEDTGKWYIMQDHIYTNTKIDTEGSDASSPTNTQSHIGEGGTKTSVKDTATAKISKSNISMFN